ncbi:MAG: DoxX family protein [Phycisphaeraceae bacterium]|nr:DoxX family protein [Phycisphaeraceae bacterium]
MSGSPMVRGFTHFALFLCRLSLGGMFALAGFKKLWPEKGIYGYDFSGFFKQLWNQVVGFANDVVIPNVPPWMPDNLAMIYGRSLPFVELVAGGLLAIGFLTRINAFLITLMLTSFLIALGINFWPEAGPPFDFNLVLVTLAFLLVFTGAGAVSIDRLIFGGRGDDDLEDDD